MSILVGSFIPLICYLAWVGVILGVLPRAGDSGLMHLFHAGRATVSLTEALEQNLSNAWITEFSRFFSSVSILTSFLGVSLSLSDFLADGFKLQKKGRQALVIFAATFLPPLAVISISPDIFLKALGYGGIFCIILLGLLPLLMVWGGRYVKKIATGYQVWGGKVTLSLGLAFAIILMILGLIEEFV